MKFQILKIALLAISLPLATHAATMKTATDKSEVKFQAIGRPSLLKINGEGKGVDGQVKIDGAKASGLFVFDLNKLSTGIEMRDTHMKEKYLQTERYKDAKLTIDSVVLPAGWTPEKPSTGEQPFEGKLSLHGVEKPLKGTFKIDDGGGAGKVPVHAEFAIKLSDYSIDIPTYAGIKIADEVKVQVNADVNSDASMPAETSMKTSTQTSTTAPPKAPAQKGK
jgi:polyisoprenoid-binding protein YceI